MRKKQKLEIKFNSRALARHAQDPGFYFQRQQEARKERRQAEREGGRKGRPEADVPSGMEADRYVSFVARI